MDEIGPFRKRMRRLENPNHLRFLTFSCVDRLPLLGTTRLRDLMVECLDEARALHGFHLVAYVIMPEHVHLLVWPKLPGSPVSRAISSAKQRFAQRAIARWVEKDAGVLARITGHAGERRAWQRGGGYDRNIMSETERLEKCGYIHANPVKRGLVARAEDWPWSSAAWYAGERTGVKLTIDPAHKPA